MADPTKVLGATSAADAEALVFIAIEGIPDDVIGFFAEGKDLVEDLSWETADEVWERLCLVGCHCSHSGL